MLMAWSVQDRVQRTVKYTIYRLQSAEFRAIVSLQYDVYSSVYSVQCIVCSVQSAVYSVQCAVCSVQCAVCSFQCAVCSVVEWQNSSVVQCPV